MRSLLAFVAFVAFLAPAGVAGATAPPVGNLPAGATSSIVTQRGQLVSIALPHAAGKSWRLARNSKPSTLREVGEADVGSNVVIVFKAAARGRATVVYALTRGETAHVFAARTFRVTVR